MIENNDFGRMAGALVAMMSVDYICVLLAVCADLCSGIMRSRRKGLAITSRGLRRSVDKLGRYYVTLFALSVTDSMILAATLYLNLFSALELTPFPVLTTLGALALAIVEVRSITENTRSRTDLVSAAKTLRALLEDPQARSLARKILRGRTKNTPGA